MDDFKGNHIPPFGSWDCNNHLPFTQCFESARQTANFIGYTYAYPQDRDLYVAGDLYENNVVTPAMIVVPRRRRKAPVRGLKKESRVVCDYDYDYDVVYGGKGGPAAEQRLKNGGDVEVKVKSKAVDEDLYKISPELLRAPPRRVFFRRCLSVRHGCRVYRVQTPMNPRDLRSTVLSNLNMTCGS